MVDRTKFLKIETTIDGTQFDMLPEECDPSEDFGAMKGVSFENSDTTVLYGDSGVIKATDTEVTSPVTLQDLAYRIKQKNVNLSSLVNGYVLTYNLALDQFELLPAGSASGGVTPPFFFSKSGNAAVGTSLRTGESVSNVTGQTIRKDSKLIEIYISNGNAVSSNTVVQMTRRTGVSTFADIVGASVTIPSGNYKASSGTLSILLNTDEEIGAYVKSGSTLNNPVVGAYIVPT